MTLAELVLNVNTGADAIKRAPIVGEDTGLRCLRIGDVSQKREYEEWGFTKTTEADYERYKLEVDDLIIARTGNTIGVNCIIEDNLNSVYNNGLIRIKADTSKVIPRYLWYMISSKDCQDFVQSIAYGTSTQPNMKINDFLRYSFEYRDLDVQKRIVEIIDPIDKKIKANIAINRNLSEQAQAIYESWFVSLEQFGGNVPEDWCEGLLGNIAEIKTTAFKPDKEPKVIVEHYSIPALDEKHFPIFEKAEGIKSNKYLLNINSVMITKLNPDTKRIWRPLCLSEKAVCSTEFIVFEAKDANNRDFIFSILDSARFSNYLCSHVTGSTGSRQRAVPKATLDFEVLIPPQETIAQFCSIVTPIYNLIASNEIENQRLSELRDELLPKLMSGELDISKI